MTDVLPDDVLRRLLPFIQSATADSDPELRGPLMRAMSGVSGVMTATAHIVGADVYVYVRTDLDNGATTTMEVPGSVVGLVTDGHSIAVVPPSPGVPPGVYF